MDDTVTIVVAYLSRQRGQSLLNVDQCFCLKVGADLFQRIDEPIHFALSEAISAPLTPEPTTMASYSGCEILVDMRRRASCSSAGGTSRPQLPI
jgi:hypothetical protein